jgi:glyoxylase-like metal-dependent hydrolase (beta-lactamase superfamily II)
MRTSFPLVSALLIAACTPRPASTGPAAGDPPLPVHAWASGADGFDTASYWIDTGEQVVVFDAQFTPTLAEALLADIRNQTESPVAYVVVTHPNPDKFNGAPVFQAAGAQVVASAATAAAMPEVHAYKQAYFEGAGVFPPGGYPALPGVDVVFDDTLKLDVGVAADVVLSVLDRGGVATTQTVAVIGGRDVIVGDLVAGGVHAWLEGGIVDGAPQPDVGEWVEALDELLAAVGPDATVWPGRGSPARAGEALPAQQAYLRTVDEIVGAYVDALPAPAAEALAAEPEAHWAALTAEAEAAFPTYGLSYLVTYGVYGLAFAHAGS